MIPQMKRKDSDGITMILLVVPRGFSTGTELLKTSAHNSQTDFPMVNLDPPVSEREKNTKQGQCDRLQVATGKYGDEELKNLKCDNL